MLKILSLTGIILIPATVSAQIHDRWFCSPSLTISTSLDKCLEELFTKKHSYDCGMELSFNESFGILLLYEQQKRKGKFIVDNETRISCALLYYLYSYDYTDIYYGPYFSSGINHYKETKPVFPVQIINTTDHLKELGLSAGYRYGYFKNFSMDANVRCGKELMHDDLNITIRLSVAYSLR